MKLNISRIRLAGWCMTAGMLVLLTACGEHSALKEETFRFAEVNRGWAPAEGLGESFIMVDGNGITQSFTQTQHSSYFTKSWSSFLGINTHMSHIEYTHASWFSTFGSGYSQSLTAGSPPHGDYMFVGVDRTEFQYDVEKQVIMRIDVPFGRLSRIITDTGYEDDEPIGSTVEHFDSLAVGGRIYEDVICFILNDFQSDWSSRTVTHIYLAKGIGLIRFVRHGGVVCDRVDAAHAGAPNLRLQPEVSITTLGTRTADPDI
ncbi:MAG: hypothetical protein PHE46_10770 [Bacteroidales bacterium]|nr:hypothetical protein [Bacteroidales bacterium]